MIQTADLTTFVLHANWHVGTLCLWASTRDGSATQTPETIRTVAVSCGSTGTAAAPQPSADIELEPPAFDAAELLEADPAEAPAAVATLVRSPLDAATSIVVPLWLPGGDGLTLKTVEMLQLTAADAMAWLVGLPESLPGSCGPSISFWAGVARFVRDRLAAGQFYPDVDQPRAGQFIGIWRPIIGPDGVDQLAAFATAMPPSCRAIVADEPVTAAALVESFVTAAVDAFVRSAVAGDDFFSRVHELARQEVSAGEVRWLSALLGSDRLFVPHVSNPAVSEQIRGWLGKLDEARGKQTWRLCLELVEPPLEDGLDADDDAPDDIEALEDDSSTDGSTATVDNEDLKAHGSAVGSGAENSPASDGNPPQSGGLSAAARSVSTNTGNPVVNLLDTVDDVQGSWTLNFSLESGGDPPTRQPAADLWADPADPAGVIGRSLSERRTQLMNELKRAADICPPIAKSLDSQTPSAVPLTTAEAHTFLRQWAGRLLDNAFGVIVPDWAKDRSQRLGMLLEVRPTFDADGDELPPELGGKAVFNNDASATQLSSGKFGLDSLLDFDWQIAVGDLRLSPEQFQQIATTGSPLVRYRGRWMEIDPAAAGRMVEFLEKKKSGQITLAEAFKTAFGISRGTEAGVPILGISGSSWIEHFLQQTPASQIENLKQPTHFEGTLRSYQLRGLDWLSFMHRLGIGACLADDMGLGKTIQLISLLLAEREQLDAQAAATGKPAERPGPTLLFAPTSVVGNWVKEVERFAKPLKVLVHHGPERLGGDLFASRAAEHDIVLTSYALAHRDLEDLQRVKWHRLALDEAQKIKNPQAAAAVAIRSLNAPHRVALTGTPIENHLSELWSIMEMLNPGLLGTASEFRERFALPIEKLADRDRAQQLRDMIKPFVLRRTKTDPQVAADLPEKMEMKVFCNLSAEQAAIYERITGEMLGQIDTAKGIRRRGLILAALTRLKQVCNHPVLALKDSDAPRTTKRISDSVTPAQLFGRSGKCERLLEMLEELIDEGDAAIIFTQYREMGHLLEQMIAERLRQPVQFLHGGTPALQRDAMIERFQKPGSEIRLFILSLRAGGLGLNLTAANHVFHFDRWWNPAVESQATDRAYRIGQTRKVQVHKFVCVGTLEERIDRLLSDKLALADQIVSSGDDWLTNLSTDELRRYLSLSRDAVGEF